MGLPITITGFRRFFFKLPSMYRFTFFILVAFITLLCIQEAFCQRGEGRRGQRAVVAEQSAAEQTAAVEGEPQTAEPVNAEDEAETDAETKEQYQPPPPPPANSLARIVDPSVADQLQLTAEQRNQAFRIINVQALELSNAFADRSPPERFLEIYKKAEDSLSNLLTATQRARLSEGLDGQTYRLVFSGQPWGDVLQFIAAQGGYHLSMTAPPPGTFTYNDPEQRTIIEVLDLVNGILITEGFTITRRDRILQVLNLRNPIPNWSFPEVRVEDLGGRASSEFIQVRHHWGRRPSDRVLAALEPLKTNNPFMRMYPAGNTVLIIDRAEIQNAVQRIINSIEEPPAPRQEEPQHSEPPPPPEWKSYTIEKNEPEKIIEIFKEYVPSARVIRLDDSRELHIFARPGEHTQLEGILKMLEADSSVSDDTERKEAEGLIIESYPIAPYFERQNVPIQVQRDRLLRRNVQGLRGGVAPVSPIIPPGADLFQLNQMQLFGLEVINILRGAFPNAVVADFPVADHIVVRATASEHTLIGEFFAALKPDKEQPVLQFYRYSDSAKRITPATAQQLQTLVPNASLTYDAEQHQIVAVAMPSEHEVLAQFVKEFESASVAVEELVFVPYRLSVSSLPSFRAMIQQLASQNRLRGYSQIEDTQRNQVLIWATAEQHELIQRVYREVTGHSAGHGAGQPHQPAVEVAVPDAVVLFTPKNIALETLIAVLEDVYPAARITTNAQRSQVVIRVRPEQREPLESLLSQLDAGDPDAERRHFKAYPITTGFYSIRANWSRYSPAQFIADLQRLAPGARISFDEQSQQLIVWGTDEEHSVIEAAVSNLIGDGSEKRFDRIELRRADLVTLRAVLRRMYPTVEISSDSVGRVLIVEGHPRLLPKVRELIDLLDPEKPSENDPVAMFYTFEREPTPAIIDGLRRLTPAAHIIQDSGNKQIMVVARPSEQEIIKKNTEAIAGFWIEPEKEIKRFALNRIPYWQALTTIYRLYPPPLTRITYDHTGNFLIIETQPELFTKIAELLAIVDPAEPTENDAVIKFYALQSEPTHQILQSLRRLVPPPAQISAEPSGKQIMVIARPAEHRIIEANVELILESFIPPEEPVLVIYEASREDRTRLESFMRIAATELRGAQILPDSMPGPGGLGLGRAAALQQSAISDNKISIWARPSEHELIATVLAQFQESQANIPERELKSFPMSVGDLAIAQNIIRTSHPDVMLFPDVSLNRLMVWATPDDMKRVAETLRVQGSIDDRQMIVYPVAGVAPATLRNVILEVFQGLKITEEPRKLLVWASPDEHVQVAQIIERANKEVDSESELAEKFVAYSAAHLDLTMILPLFRAIIPEADVHATLGSDKVVVRAIARDHKRIEELFTQLREKDDTLRPRLEVYLFGETDPVMVEAMLRNQLPNAESMSPDDLVMRLGWSFYYQRMPWTRSQIQTPQPVKSGYFKIDPQTRTAHVFVTDEQHKEVNEAMQQLLAASSQEGLQLTVRRYSMDNITDFWDVRQLIQRVAPSALYQQIWEQVLTPGGWYSWRTTGDFLAYTFEAEHEKLEALVKELNDRTGTNRKEMLSISLPEQTPFSRERIIETIQRVYTDITPMQGGLPNQILVWAPQHRLEQVQKIVDDITQPLPEGHRTVPRSYPLQYIGVDEAVAWLGSLYPNALFNPDGTAPSFVRPGAARFVVAVATPLEHAEIAKTIDELDKDVPEPHKSVPRIYTLDELTAGEFFRFSSMLPQAFPQSVFTSTVAQRTVLAVAREEEHKRIADLVQTYQDEQDRHRPMLEVYTLKRHNYHLIAPLLQRVAPTAFLSAGATGQQVTVWGTPKEQSDIADTLGKLETAAGVELDYKMAIYKTGTGRSGIAQGILRWQFPGAIIFPLNQNELFVWAAPYVHEAIEPSLASLAESFPEPELKPYFFKHVQLGEAATILQQAFAGQVISMTPRQNDLLVYASPDIHAKIAASIANFDIPRPADTESETRLFDLSELPPGTFWQAAAQIHDALQYRIQVTQGVVPGQLVAVGRPADLAKVEQIVEQMLGNNIPHETKHYDLSALPPGVFWHTAGQIQHVLQHRIQVMQGAVPGLLVVVGRPADLVRVDTIVKQLLDELPDATAVLQVYTVRRGNARTVEPLLRQIVPNLRIDYGTNQNQLLVWTKESDHVKIKDVIDRLNESDADVTLRVYHFEHVFLHEAMAILQSAFSSSATLTPRHTSGDLLAFASSEVHEQIAASIASFDVQRPAELDAVPRVYDVGDLPAEAIVQAAQQIRIALQYRVHAIPGAALGQLVVWAKPADHEKVDAFVKQMLGTRTETETKYYDLSALPPNAFWVAAVQIRQSLQNRVQTMSGVTPGQLVVVGRPADLTKVDSIIKQILEERPDATAEVKVYTVQRLSNMQDFRTMLPVIAPNARAGGNNVTNPSQILVWANPADHAKLSATVHALNDAEPDIKMQIHPLRNIEYNTAFLVLNTVIAGRGLDVRMVRETFGNQLVVLARPEDQTMVADVLEKLRAEDREFLFVPLEIVDPMTAQSAVVTMFADEPINVRPFVTVDLNTNAISVLAVPGQLERIAKMLRDAGEHIWYPAPPPGAPQGMFQQPGAGFGVRQHPGSNIRTIHIQGHPDILRDLERHWRQIQPNPLRIITPPTTEEQQEPKEEGEPPTISAHRGYNPCLPQLPSFFSLEDEIQRDSFAFPTLDPVYVVVNADSSLTVTSADVEALDQLEALLRQISSGIVFEGRDYTIFAVRNTSADVVAARLNMVLREKLMQQMPSQTSGQPARPRLLIQPDLIGNTIYVQGSRSDRNEVGRLIPQFDVSDLPGTPAVQKPVTVFIENTEASRVWTEVMKVYQLKLQSTRLPGGITPRIIVNNVSNALEIFAPDPLLTELKEYIEEVDRRALEEPGRKLHVIQLGVKAPVLEQAMMRVRQRYMQNAMMQNMQVQPYGMMPMVQPMPMFPGQQIPRPNPTGVRR